MPLPAIGAYFKQLDICFMSRDIEIDQIRPDPDQPRSEFDEDELEELAQSLDQNGQVVPITVRPADDGEEEYIIIAGERRWRAARRLGWDILNADVRDEDPEKARLLALIENVQREDLTPIEEARAYRRELDRHDLTQAELAERIGKSQSYVAQKLRLLQIPDPVSFWLEKGLLSEGHLRQLLRTKGFYLEGATSTYDPGKTKTTVESFIEVSQWYNGHRPVDWPPFLPAPEEESVRERLWEGAERYASYVAEEGPTIDSWTSAAWFYGGLAHYMGWTVSELSGVIDQFEKRLRSHYDRFGILDPPWIEAVPDAPQVQYEHQRQEGQATVNNGGVPVSELTMEEAQQALGRLFYWGGLADLRHAGTLGALQATFRRDKPERAREVAPEPTAREPDLTDRQVETNKDILWKSVVDVTMGKGFIYPSTMSAAEAPETPKRKELKARMAELKLEA